MVSGSNGSENRGAPGAIPDSGLTRRHISPFKLRILLFWLLKSDRMANPLFRKKSISNIVAETKDAEASGSSLKKVLGVRDLVSMGIAAVVGAGIFSTIGSAAFHGGPGISLLFII